MGLLNPPVGLFNDPVGPLRFPVGLLNPPVGLFNDPVDPVSPPVGTVRFPKGACGVAVACGSACAVATECSTASTSPPAPARYAALVLVDSSPCLGSLSDTVCVPVSTPFPAVAAADSVPSASTVSLADLPSLLASTPVFATLGAGFFFGAGGTQHAPSF